MTTYWVDANRRDFPYAKHQHTEDDYLNNIEIESELQQLNIDNLTPTEIRDQLMSFDSKIDIPRWLETLDYSIKTQRLIKAIDAHLETGPFAELQSMSDGDLLSYTLIEEDLIAFMECLSREFTYYTYLIAIRQLPPISSIGIFWYHLMEKSPISSTIGQDILADLLGKGAIFHSEYPLSDPQKILQLIIDRRICNLVAIYQLRDLGAGSYSEVINTFIHAPLVDDLMIVEYSDADTDDEMLGID